MGNKKKLGKYFTKGLQAGVLASALAATTAGCANDPIFHEATITFNKPGVCVGETVERSSDNLAGAQFVGVAEDWRYDYIDESEEFNKHFYSKAKPFTDLKMAELQQLVSGKSQPLYQTINTAIKKCQANYSNNIGIDITTNYEALASVFAALEDNLPNRTPSDFLDCYYQLARNAYNRNKGPFEHDKNCRTNAEMLDLKPFFQSLQGVQYSNETLLTMAKSYMNDILQEIARQTQTDPAVLNKVVELALYNESLYGLNDFAVKCGVKLNYQSFLKERSLTMFVEYIKAAQNHPELGGGSNGWQDGTIKNGVLGGANILDENEDWRNGNVDHREAFNNNYYSEAKPFISWEIAKLQEAVNGQTNPMYQIINTAMKKCQANYLSNIGVDIITNYEALGPVFAAFEDNLPNHTPSDLRDCYYQLARNAYNRNKGVFAKDPNCKTNAEMLDQKPFFQTPGVEYTDAALLSAAKDYMLQFLRDIASQTRTDPALLQRVVELALYNESLYGLNDFAVKCGVKLNYQDFIKEERSLSMFMRYIDNAKSQTANLDDRTK